jgi:hypothetical protein
MAMDKETAERFNALMKEEPGSLSLADREFLRARKSYFLADQLERFASIFDEKDEAQKEAEGEEPAKPSKPSKK